MAVGFDNPKITQHIQDGAEFARQNKGRFDVVITDSSDPLGTGDPVFSPNPMRPHPLLSCDCYHDELTATFDPTMRFKRSNSNLENFHDVFGVAAFSLLLTPWRDIS